MNFHHQELKFRWRSIASEFIGTMFYIFTTSISVASTSYIGQNTVVINSLSNGFVLFSLIHIFSPISGGHFNPAITLATIITRHIGILEGTLYIFSQFVGGISGGALALLVFKEGDGLGNFGTCFIRPQNMGEVEFTVFRAFSMELLLTCFLSLAYFGSLFKAKHLAHETNQQQITILLSGITIGCTMIGLSIASSITGGCLNPARALGTGVVSSKWSPNSWIYYVAPFIGALIGGIIFEFILTEPRESYIRLK